MTLPPWHVPGLEATKGHKGFLDEVMLCVYLSLLKQAWDLLIWQRQSGWEDVLKGDACKAPGTG